MRSVKTLVIAAVLACTVAAYGQSVIVYSVETGGNNHAADWEGTIDSVTAYTSGVSDGTTEVNAGEDLNWAVRVTVGGVHSGQPGHGYAPFGAANLVFDLVVEKADHTPADLGAAPMSCVSGAPGQAGMDCKPTDKGFYSTINDGDADGIRGIGSPDIWANAAFAVSIFNVPDAQGVVRRSVVDAAPDGPNFDYGWYPTANGRGGIDIDGTKPVNTSVNKAELNGKLVGFGAGYKNYNFASYRPGVGLYEVEAFGQLGFGADIGYDPQLPQAAERPLFEGQLCTKNMPAGTYYLKVIPSANGNNILHGSVDWTSTTGSYGGYGSFAAKANSAVALQAQANGVKFVIKADPSSKMLARNVFYNNTYYDGNKPAIDAAPIATTNHDDDVDAIDTAKSPLVVGPTPVETTFANYTACSKGITGLMYDIKLGSSATRNPLASDFTFTNVGKTGTTSAAVTPAASAVQVLSDKVRVIFTFNDNAVKNTWLKVDVGTGFGLAAAETHYWGNVAGDVNIGNVVQTGTTALTVSGADELSVRSNPTPFGTPAAVTNIYDINKDKNVNSQDQLIIRSNNTSTFTCVKTIKK